MADGGEEWRPNNELLGAKGTVSSKVALQSQAFDFVAKSEIRKQEKNSVGKPGEKALAKAAEIRTTHPGNLCARYFTKEYFDSLDEQQQKRFLKITASGINNPDSAMGCYAMNPTDYDDFKPFFENVLAEYHGTNVGQKHTNNWDLTSVEGLPADGQLSLLAFKMPPASMRVRVGRNLADFPLPGAMFKQHRVRMEKKMCKAFDKLISMPEYGGKYYSLTPDHPSKISDEEYAQLVKEHVMFKDMSADSYLVEAGIANDWPYGRGCYCSEDREFIIWVGEEDHLRIMAMKKGHLLNGIFDRLKSALDIISGMDGLTFATSPDFGIVTSCPTNLGTGMRASVHMQLPKLTEGGSDVKAKKIAKPLGLSVRGMGGEHTVIGADGTCDISPSARFCISEAQIIKALYDGVKALKDAEEAA